jgi:hypothetical protein
MNATATAARWITTRNGKRALAFNGETDAQAQARYDRINAWQNDMETVFDVVEAEAPALAEPMVSDEEIFEMEEMFDAPEAEPRSIRFDGHKCRRCDGHGRDGAWLGVNNGKCFDCNGSGWHQSEAGREASKAYDAAINAAYVVEFGTLKVGERFALIGSDKWLYLRVERDLKALPSHEKVVRDQPKGTQARIMREIAAQYPGATLVY